VFPPFFFNRESFLGGQRAQTADLLVDRDQFLRQCLKATKLGDFLFGLP
jgi:hypothetical protein